MSEFDVKRDQVFVAGLSAGGAMAAILGEAYSDLFAGIGIHSGLACGSANDVLSALSAMRGDGGLPRQRQKRAVRGPWAPTRTILFHGTADRTVHPSNATRIMSELQSGHPDATVRSVSGGAEAGRTYTRTILSDRAGLPIVEQWLVDGAVHAWSGGRAGGSYTDPKGPDASNEMVRFFMLTLP